MRMQFAWLFSECTAYSAHCTIHAFMKIIIPNFLPLHADPRDVGLSPPVHHLVSSTLQQREPMYSICKEVHFDRSRELCNFYIPI